MIKNIISKMTFEEKAKMLTYVKWLETAENGELGIPKLVMADGPHGIRPLAGTPEHIKGGSTAFPTASALSATWNRDLAYKTGAGIARDCLEQGVDVNLGPGINIKRTSLCGRNFEYFSEDPYLAGEMGAGYIRGCEEQGVGACLKHYALNNQEIQRTTINVEVDERTLREIYLKPFEISVKKGNPSSIMAAYNKAFGTKCAQNKKLFDILRNEWNYDGVIISDWEAVTDSVASFVAGLNLEMPSNKSLPELLKKGIDNGEITEEQIDERLERFLKFVFKIKNAPKCTDEFNRDRQHTDAYEVASEAVTLLKNENETLPITKNKYKKIFVLGPWAEKPQIMGGGSSIVFTKDEMIDSPLEEIKKLAGDEFEVIYSPCYGEVDRANLVATTVRARRCFEECTDDDIVLCFVSSVNAESEGLDRYSLHFENYIDMILYNCSLKCKNLVVIMQTGTAYTPYRWDENTPAIIQMWLSGEAGGKAIADILFGKVNPSGKLAETFPKNLRCDMEHVSLNDTIVYTEKHNIGYRYYDNHTDEIWYPFGHGLSYTEFEYKKLLANVNSDNIEISFEITNIGTVDGKETAQIYIGKDESSFERPKKELKDFAKTMIKSGETQKLYFKIPLSDIAVYDDKSVGWTVEPGKYQIYIGSSSQDIRLKDTVNV